MNRRNFLKTSAMGMVGLTVVSPTPRIWIPAKYWRPALLDRHLTYHKKIMERLGFQYGGFTWSADSRGLVEIMLPSGWFMNPCLTTWYSKNQPYQRLRYNLMDHREQWRAIYYPDKNDTYFLYRMKYDVMGVSRLDGFNQDKNQEELTTVWRPAIFKPRQVGISEFDVEVYNNWFGECRAYLDKHYPLWHEVEAYWNV